jgi:hypothetical protein
MYLPLSRTDSPPAFLRILHSECGHQVRDARFDELDKVVEKLKRE